MNEIITQETLRIFPNCQACSHEWTEHIEGCSHDNCNCQAKVDESILEEIMFFNGQKIMIDVFDDFFMIRKENNSDEYLIQASYQGDNDHKCDSSHDLVSWKFIGIQDKIEANFQCDKCHEIFKVFYDYHDTESYEEIGIDNPFKKVKNEFFSYAISEDNGGYYVKMYDLNQEDHDICFTKNKKLAEYLEKHFDNLAIAEERELFD